MIIYCLRVSASFFSVISIVFGFLLCVSKSLPYSTKHSPTTRQHLSILKRSSPLQPSSPTFIAPSDRYDIPFSLIDFPLFAPVTSYYSSLFSWAHKYLLFMIIVHKTPFLCMLAHPCSYAFSEFSSCGQNPPRQRPTRANGR